MFTQTLVDTPEIRNTISVLGYLPVSTSFVVIDTPAQVCARDVVEGTGMRAEMVHQRLVTNIWNATLGTNTIVYPNEIREVRVNHASCR
jgi:hypothetical protein